MTDRRDFLQRSLTTLGAVGFAQPLAAQPPAAAEPQQPSGADARAYWVGVLNRIARPVLTHLAARQLKAKMPVEAAPGAEADRRQVTYLEALGRTLAGIAPWLELDSLTGAEGKLRAEFAALARQAIDAATDPASPDLMNFTEARQPVVDAAFLSHAILRAPNELWKKLEPKTQRNLVVALKASRVIRPAFSNWLLFSAMVEAALSVMGEAWDEMRVDYALRQHEQWYKGDGVYGDGPEFHWDYYNSFVIQPMLLDVLRVVGSRVPEWNAMTPKVTARARRYAAIQERLISPEGTFPAIGRSLAYRFGAFQLLAQIALTRQLPEHVTPAQVRCALSAVIRRMIEARGTFDAQGWLTIGFCGRQPKIGERYISTGSVCLCTVGLLPLGLPPDDEFWKSPPQDWTAKKIWTGEDFEADHAI